MAIVSPSIKGSGASFDRFFLESMFPSFSSVAVVVNVAVVLVVVVVVVEVVIFVEVVVVVVVVVVGDLLSSSTIPLVWTP